MVWGDDGDKNNPWGKPSSGRPNGANGSNKQQVPPNKELEELIDRFQGKVKRMVPGGGGGGKRGNSGNDKKLIGAVVAIAVLVFLIMDMFYIVREGERGVITRFGQFTETTRPGPHFRLPTPIEKVEIVNVDRLHTEEIGEKNNRIQSMNSRSSTRSAAEESLMLTKDENIVDVEMEVQWRINDAPNYLFNVFDGRFAHATGSSRTVHYAAESALRDVIGNTTYANAISKERERVSSETEKFLQSILDSYQMGIEISSLQIKAVEPPPQVIDAFRDVQSARADKENMINKAEAYSNDILPKARGEAARLIESAKAYKEEVTASAQGESERFESVYKQYVVAKDVTRQRMYLETMEEVLGKVNKVIIDTDVSGSGVLPYLPLNELKKKSN